MTPTQKEYIEGLPFPVSFSCVDMIVATPDKHIVFIKKSYKDDLLRLPGGMVDPTDLTLRKAAYRELEEEISAYRADLVSVVELSEFLTNDAGRYCPSLSQHRLRTKLFGFVYIGDVTKLKAGDDATDLELVPVDQLYDINWVTSNVAPGHIPLLYTWLATNKNLW